MMNTLKITFLVLLTIQGYQFVSAASNTCGSLLSYRHYLVQLEAAPKCFTDGCAPQNKPTSMSDICPEERPCSELWNLIHDQYQQDWCSQCTHDVACRTRGWPTLNASALCDITPNKWIFGSDGLCCTAGNEAFELAEWLGSMCNDSEWRIPFKYFDGSAKLDWEEWIMPWNWTVRVENTTSTTYRQRECPSIYLSLLAIAVENVLILLFVVALTMAKLKYIQARGDGNPYVLKFHDACHVLLYLKFWHWPEGFKRLSKKMTFLPPEKPEDATKVEHQALFSIIFSALMTGFQVGFNFLSAWRIHSTLGYQNVPIGYLAILFCCRPRLTWLACSLELLRPETVQSWFKFKDKKWESKARYTLSTISFGSALSEFVLQGISIYSFGLTVNTGRVRDFYLANHLQPYWRGPAALAMYIGALFWVIGGLLILIVWVYVFFLAVKVAAVAREIARRFHVVSDRAKSSKRLTKAFPRLKRRPKSPVIKPQQPQNEGGSVPHNTKAPGQDNRGGNQEGVLQGHDDGQLQPQHNYPHSGDTDRIDPVVEDHEAGLEKMHIHLTPSSGGHGNDRVEMSGANRNATSSPLSYGATSHTSRSDTLLGSNYYDESNNLLPFNEVPFSKSESRYDVIGEEVEASGETAEISDERTPQQREDEETKHIIILLAMAISMAAYGAQLMFWGGFVYTARERFCPPSIFSTAGIWLAASLSGLGLPFLIR